MYKVSKKPVTAAEEMDYEEYSNEELLNMVKEVFETDFILEELLYWLSDDEVRDFLVKFYEENML